MPNSFEEAPTYENPHLKEYPEDFGNEAGEQMVAKLIENLPGCKIVKRASKFDDQRTHVDMFIAFKNGSELAIDATCTGSPKEQRQKVQETSEKRQRSTTVD